jgi:hypothetical protein
MPVAAGPRLERSFYGLLIGLLDVLQSDMLVDFQGFL